MPHKYLLAELKGFCKGSLQSMESGHFQANSYGFLDGGDPWVGLLLPLLAGPPPPPKSGEDFAPSSPHRSAFFPCHYHPVKQRGQSESIWITLTIAYYLGQDCPHSPPPAPTAAFAGPFRSPASLIPPPPTIGQPGRAEDRLVSLTLPVPSSRTLLLYWAGS